MLSGYRRSFKGPLRIFRDMEWGVLKAKEWQKKKSCFWIPLWYWDCVTYILNSEYSAGKPQCGHIVQSSFSMCRPWKEWSLSSLNTEQATATARLLTGRHCSCTALATAWKEQLKGWGWTDPGSRLRWTRLGFLLQHVKSGPSNTAYIS